MRDIVLTAIIFSLLFFALKQPYVGVLLWSWVSYMNPHRLTWGFAFYFPFVQIIAIVTLLSLLFCKDIKKIPITGLTALWFVFFLWMTLTTALAVYPDAAWDYYVKVLKVMAPILLTMMLMYNRERINMLIWVIVFSIGFFGIKGGIFTLTSGGSARVWGPPGGVIEGNNELGVALLMVLPLMRYLQVISENKWVRRGVGVAMVLSLISVAGTQSRGAFLAATAALIFLGMKSNRKIAMTVFGAIVGISVYVFMPETWHDRMGTIQTYEEDGSAMGRIIAWQYSVNVASERLFGAGFEAWSGEMFFRYGPPDSIARVAHSIYFHVLADHGWIGLMLFVTIFLIAWRTASWVIKQSKEIAELAWAENLAKMIQVSFIAYAVGGAFLSLSYFDLPWHLVAILVLLKEIVKAHKDEHKLSESGSKPAKQNFRPRSVGVSSR